MELVKLKFEDEPEDLANENKELNKIEVYHLNSLESKN